MWKTIFITSALVGFSFAPAWCEEPDFQTTQDEIVRSLTKEPVRYRSLSPPGQTRAIRVLKKEASETVQDTIQVNTSQEVSQARLKIGFDYDSYAIRSESYPLLDELGKALTSPELGDRNVLIKGHTDSDGPASYNLELSLNRAQSVKNYLSGRFRIPASRLEVIGYGEGLPLVANDTSRHKQMNRRVEIQAVD